VFEQKLEEGLGQILRRVRSKPALPDKSINGIPVGPTKSLQGRRRTSQIGLSSFQHHTPMGSVKLSPVLLTIEAFLIGLCHAAIELQSGLGNNGKRKSTNVGRSSIGDRGKRPSVAIFMPRGKGHHTVRLPLAGSFALNSLVPASQTLLFLDPRPLVERLGAEFFRQLPACPGVYLMQDAAEVVLYVGKAKSLRQRLSHYRVANPDRMGRRHLRLLRQVVRIELQECADEIAALAREAELLRALKPKFNRAGVWPATPRLLVWRCTGQTLEMAINETPALGWQGFGPFGGGVVHLRAALVRLLWYALNSVSGSTTMPHGWLHGRIGAIATLVVNQSGVDLVLMKLFEGDTEGFVAWIGERTKSLVQAYDVEMRDADLETVTHFMQAKARRTLPFATPDPSAPAAKKEPEAMLPFLGADWQQP